MAHRSNITNDATVLSEPITYGLDVIAVYKEESGVSYGDTVTFITESGSSFCGVFLELDSEYLIDLTRQESDGELHGVSCGLVREWSTVDDADLADLESGCAGTGSSSSSNNSTTSDSSVGGGNEDGADGDDDGATDGDDGGIDDQVGLPLPPATVSPCVAPMCCVSLHDCQPPPPPPLQTVT